MASVPQIFQIFDVVYNLSHTIDRSLVESRVVVELWDEILM